MRIALVKPNDLAVVNAEACGKIARTSAENLLIQVIALRMLRVPHKQIHRPADIHLRRATRLLLARRAGAGRDEPTIKQPAENDAGGAKDERKKK